MDEGHLRSSVFERNAVLLKPQMFVNVWGPVHAVADGGRIMRMIAMLVVSTFPQGISPTPVSSCILGCKQGLISSYIKLRQ